MAKNLELFFCLHSLAVLEILPLTRSLQSTLFQTQGEQTKDNVVSNIGFYVSITNKLDGVASVNNRPFTD